MSRNGPAAVALEAAITSGDPELKAWAAAGRAHEPVAFTDQADRAEADTLDLLRVVAAVEGGQVTTPLWPQLPMWSRNGAGRRAVRRGNQRRRCSDAGLDLGWPDLHVLRSAPKACVLS